MLRRSTHAGLEKNFNMAPKKLSDKSRAKLNEALEDSLNTKVIKSVQEHNVLWDNRLDAFKNNEMKSVIWNVFLHC